MNNFFIIFGVVFLLFLCGGCIERETTPVEDSNYMVDQMNIQEEDISVIHKQRINAYYCDIWVLHDNKRNVTCWKVSGGLSCIPDSLLEVKEE